MVLGVVILVVAEDVVADDGDETKGGESEDVGEVGHFSLHSVEVVAGSLR